MPTAAVFVTPCQKSPGNRIRKPDRALAQPGPNYDSCRDVGPEMEAQSFPAKCLPQGILWS
jgi:hypothetical protein